MTADANQPAALILLDLSAAFDTVDHRILLQPLAACGVPGTALLWVSSFLRDRTQRVQLGGHVSHTRSVHCGVPQGSALSPLLFNVYLQPLIVTLAQMDCHLFNYADDTQLFIKIDNSAQVNVQNILRFVTNWMTSNWLKINPD